MQTYRYQVVDVFTERPLEGNPLAVFADGTAIDDLTMQGIARELNLSETVFILPPMQSGCVARVRIFTPRQELAFAGHPTIGTSFVLLQNGILPNGGVRFLLEEKIGPVPIRVERSEKPLIWLTTPPIEFGQTLDRGACASALGLATSDLLDHEPQIVTAGNPFLFVPLRNKEIVDRAWLDMSGIGILKRVTPHPNGVFVFAPVAEGAYSRMFAPEHGIAEDPATGSATGPLAAYMIRHNLVPRSSPWRFVSEQGTKMRRRSFLHVQTRGHGGSEGIEVGGYVTPIVRAEMQLGGM